MANKSMKGDGEPLAASHKTPNINPHPADLDPVVDGVDYPVVKPQGDAIVKLDGLLVENEARGTIYYLALGLIAKQARAKLKLAHPKKKLTDLFDEFIRSLKLSAERSPRTVQRYIQLVEKMSDDGTLKGTLADALREANFSETNKAEVLQITGGVGLTDLYVLYGMVEDKKTNKLKVEKSIEDRLMDQVISLVGTYKQLTKIRGELVGAGEAIDPALDELVSKTCDAAVALSKHPIIAAKLKTLEDEAGAEGANA